MTLSEGAEHSVAVFGLSLCPLESAQMLTMTISIPRCSSGAMVMPRTPIPADPNDEEVMTESFAVDASLLPPG